MFKKLAICTPAILDLDVIQITANTIKKNLIDVNPDFDISFFVSVDNYQRDGATGSFNDIRECYENLQTDNCNVEVIITGIRLGLNSNYKLLMKKFIDSDCTHCLFIDDDYQLINELHLSDIASVFSEDVIVHLSAAKKEVAESFSHESPFLINEIKHEAANTVVYLNNRNFHTGPGTFFSKQQAEQIYDEVDFSQKKANSEDLIGHANSYRSKDIVTVFFKTENMQFVENEEWNLPLNNHFLYDSIRALSGQSAAELLDYNP